MTNTGASDQTLSSPTDSAPKESQNFNQEGSSVPLVSDFVEPKSNSSRIRLLDHLPAIFQGESGQTESSFTERFLRAFEEYLNDFETRIEESSLAMNVDFAPPEFLPWLAECVGLTLDSGFPESKKRRFLHEAAALFRMRGSRRGLSRHLEIYSGVKPQIFDRPHRGLKLGEGTVFGRKPRLGHLAEHTFLVVLTVPRSSKIDMNVVKRIIEAHRPAHTAYELSVIETDL